MTSPHSASFLARASWMWRTQVRRPALFWTEYVSYRLGSLIAASFFPTRISANTITLLGLVVHGLGAAVVVVAPSSLPAAVSVLLVWQVAFGFDCADGLLARSRSQTSTFGAWLDQVVDFAAHLLVFGSLALACIGPLGLTPQSAATFSIWVVGANLSLGYSVGVKAAAGVERRRLTADQSGVASIAARSLHLTDYGFVLFMSAVLLVAPTILAGYLILNGVMSVGAVIAQFGLYASAPRS